MKKRGFTLIELLAVIVVLAIIALIATPIVMNVIKKANAGAAERSADNYIKAVETLIATEKLDGTPVVDGEYSIDANGNLTFGTVEVSGTKPNGGAIVIKDEQVDKNSSTIVYEDYTVKFEDGKAKAEEVKKLAPGLYDENDNLKISWADLTSTEYKSFDYYEWNDSIDDYEEVTRAILNVDENGVLTAAYFEADSIQFSSEYLVGKLVIDDSVTSIKRYAFYGCNGLTSITIPDSVTSIGEHAFMGCIGLTRAEIGNNVTSIGPNAFSFCDELTSIIIPDGVTIIEVNAFVMCPKLANVTIPDSVTSIGDRAFGDCTSLTTINYKGTEAEWNAITKGSNWDKDTPSNKEMNYNYKG